MFWRQIASQATVARAARAAAAVTAVGTASLATAATCATRTNDIELRYFDGQGAVETSRLLMALSGCSYTDTRWKMDMSQPYGQRCPGFLAAKEAGELKANLDRAPILLVDGVAIGQSKSIERFLAQYTGLYGSNEVQGALIDAFTEHIRDLKLMHAKAPDAAKFTTEVLPAFLQKMERTAGEDALGCIVGTSLSLADVALYELLCDYFPAREAYLRGRAPAAAQPGGAEGSDGGSSAQGHEAMLKDCPKLAAAVEAVGSHPRIAAHVASRQYTAPW